MLYYALTGEAPFPRENELATLFAHANAPRPRPSEVRPGLSTRFDAVVEKAMAVDPEERFPVAGAVGRALNAVVEDERTLSLDQSPVPAPAVRHGARRRWPWAVAAAAVAAAMAAAVVVLASGDDHGSEEPPPVAAAPVSVGRGPVAVAVGPERVWVAARDGDEVDAIDQVTNQVAFEIPVPGPASVAIGFGSVWAVSKATDTLYRLDPLEGTAPLQIPLGDGADPTDVAPTGAGSGSPRPGLRPSCRVDPETNAVAGQRPARHRTAGACDGRRIVWVTNVRAASVSRIDPDGPERVGSSIAVGELPSDVAVGEGSVWVISNLNGTMYELDPETGKVEGDPIEVGSLPRGVAAGLGSSGWRSVATVRSSRIDPAHARGGRRAGRGRRRPGRRDARRDAVWAVSEGDATATRLSP